MQDSPTALILIAVLLTILHTLVATYLLIRNADKKANWNIRISRTILGQIAVFAAAVILSAGLLAINRVVPVLSTVESFVAAPVFFLLLCWLGQIRLVIYLASHRGRRRFLQPWELRRIAFITMLQITFYYICVSLVALGAITYAEWLKQNAGSVAARKLAATAIQRQMHCHCHAVVPT